jgi:hypothetical protein
VLLCSSARFEVHHVVVDPVQDVCSSPPACAVRRAGLLPLAGGATPGHRVGDGGAIVAFKVRPEEPPSRRRFSSHMFVCSCPPSASACLLAGAQQRAIVESCGNKNSACRTDSYHVQVLVRPPRGNTVCDFHNISRKQLARVQFAELVQVGVLLPALMHTDVGLHSPPIASVAHSSIRPWSRWSALGWCLAQRTARQPQSCNRRRRQQTPLVPAVLPPAPAACRRSWPTSGACTACPMVGLPANLCIPMTPRCSRLTRGCTLHYPWVLANF